MQFLENSWHSFVWRSNTPMFYKTAASRENITLSLLIVSVNCVTAIRIVWNQYCWLILWLAWIQWKKIKHHHILLCACYSWISSSQFIKMYWLVDCVLGSPFKWWYIRVPRLSVRDAIIRTHCVVFTRQNLQIWYFRKITILQHLAWMGQLQHWISKLWLL